MFFLDMVIWAISLNLQVCVYLLLVPERQALVRSRASEAETFEALSSVMRPGRATVPERWYKIC